MSVLIVHDTPLKSGLHFGVLDAIFKANKAEYEIVNVVPHMADKELRKVKPDQWLAETARIHKAAEKHEKILCSGGLAAASYFGSERAQPITKVRGRGYLGPTGKYTICTYQPSTVVKDTDFFRDLAFDVEKLLHNDAPLRQPELEVVAVETRADLAILNDLHGASFCACDIETTSLNPMTADILGIGFCVLHEDGSGYVVVVPQKLIGREVHKFLRTYKGTLIFHNLKFDTQHLWRKYKRFEFKDVTDTMLMAYALDERPFNRYRAHGLDILQRLHFDAPPKSVNMGDWLREYFRVDAGEDVRWKWVEEFCTEHPEKARSCWREWHKQVRGQEPDWRGRKVGREIAIEEVAHCLPFPEHLLPAPTPERKAEMWDQMLTYMAEDCFSTARLFALSRERIADESPRLNNLVDNTLVPASAALAFMELGGAPVDIPYLEKMKVEIEELLEQEMSDIRSLVQEHTIHPKGEEFNPNSSKQVKEVLYDEEVGLGLKMPQGVGRYAYKRGADEITTNSDTLKVLARQVAKKQPAVAKLINKILNYRVKSKIVSTYIDGLLERVDEDKRIRGDFLLHGTATGRLSCANPNLQNIPDASHVGYDIRRAYVASPGWTCLEADYSQLELRVAALFSQDEVMLEAYRNGADIHQEVAYLLWNKPKDQITKYERYLAKCMNFGVIYGRGARSIATGPEMDNLVEMSGRSWNNSEIDTYFAKFKVGYADLFRWMELIKKDSIQKRYVENPLGHRRRFDLIMQTERGHVERQIVNTPIQGFAAYMTLRALVELDKRFDPEKQRLLFTVHDSIFCECREDKKTVQETAALIKHTMENVLPEDVVCSFPTLAHAPFSEGDALFYNLPFVADVVVGPNWGTCYQEAHEYEPVLQREEVMV